MTERITVSGRLTEILRTIEGNPSSSAFWEVLAQRVRGQNDQLSFKSLEIIIGGLKRVEYLTAQAAIQNTYPPKIPAFFQTRFLRLAGAYNNPALLKEVGTMYLRDLNMPEVALQHFECSLRLGGPEKDLRPLREAAAAAMKKQIGFDASSAASTVTAAQNVNAIAPNIISKTGSMMMRSRIRQSTVSTLEDERAGEAEFEQKLPETGIECLEEAKSAIVAGSLPRAEALLKKANRHSLSSAAMWLVWTDLGLAYYDAGRYPKVESAFVEALKYNFEDMVSLFNVALGYHINDKAELALSFYERANALEPNNSKILCNLGVLHFQQTHYEQAEYALRLAVIARPDYARAWDNLAATLGAQDRLEDALAACERTVEIDSNFPEAHFKAGIIYFFQEKFEKASIALHKASVVPVLKGYCESFQAMIYCRMGQLEEAETAVRRAIEADPSCDLLCQVWKEIGGVWNSLGNYSRAAVAYTEAVLLKPDQPDAWYLLSVIHQHLGDTDSAAYAYQQSLDLNTSFRSPVENTEDRAPRMVLSQ